VICRCKFYKRFFATKTVFSVVDLLSALTINDYDDHLLVKEGPGISPDLRKSYIVRGYYSINF